MAKRIVITSGKGGVGKTTITANLGNALADCGQRVVMVDMDFGLNNLDVVTGIENKIIYDMYDVILGRCRIKQALIQDKLKNNLYILPSANSLVNSEVTGQNIKLLLDKLNFLFDYVLIDCPAGIDIGFHRAISCAEQAIVVTTPSFSSLRDADKVIKILKSYKLNSVDLIINRLRGDLILGQKMMYPNDIEALLQSSLLGVLPEEDIVFLSIGKKLPKRTDSSRAYKIIAENILKGNNKLFDVTKKYTGFLGGIKRGLKSL